MKFFIPSEWAPDTAGGNGATGELIGAMTLPQTLVISMKRIVHNYPMARASERKIAFAASHPGVILERCMLFSHLCSTGPLTTQFWEKKGRRYDDGIYYTYRDW